VLRQTELLIDTAEIRKADMHSTADLQFPSSSHFLLRIEDVNTTVLPPADRSPNIGKRNDLIVSSILMHESLLWPV
jgi:hypothetical protein